MARLEFAIAIAFALTLLALSSTASAAIVEHTFHVKNLKVSKLCHRSMITAVNESLPGPNINIEEGDTLHVHVINQSPYNLTIHWHGVLQLMTGWADGPSYVTQCPILPGSSYTYRFTIAKQEGTLWWHAHVSWLRATVYGALIIRPRSGHNYPFPKPQGEVPILLGEWWNANVIDVENEALATGAAPNNSDAYTINGRPGDLYPCSQTDTYKLKVQQGKTYLLRIINAALNNQLFFKIADHKMTIVAVDAVYTKPYVTDVVLVTPGQTTDVLLTANQAPGAYYMAARPYNSVPINVPINNSTTRGIMVYENAPLASTTPKMPSLPRLNDTATAHRLNSNLTSLVGAPHWVPVPRDVDEHMYVTVGLGLELCEKNRTCGGVNGQKFSASMNNHSFQFPTKLSMLEAFFFNVKGIYTTDFPSKPPVKFDYTNMTNSNNAALLFAPKRTSVKKVKFNATNHPMHLHGFNFHVLAQGFGNFNPRTDRKKFNLVDPQIRNTIGVPVGGWAAIRFTADNPGVWIMHCHLDVHLPLGFATAFVVENGPTAATTLPPPPKDLPKC
ncbi:hypothetical protein CRG98_025735 [Punica granatum]|uniref:Laccase n=1 Tax=Punica granatum TaxID=22663 RepID=A0A2I0JD43_PUNGR|nr:hypothetical protein CRG98_025735 [Punica granatum]